MQTRSFECDRCGKKGTMCGRGNAYEDEDGNPIQIWYVAVMYSSVAILEQPALNLYQGGKTRVKAEWCRDCLDATGLIPPPERKETEAPPPPTIEDAIREIVREETQQ